MAVLNRCRNPPSNRSQINIDWNCERASNFSIWHYNHYNSNVDTISLYKKTIKSLHILCKNI